VAVGIMRDEVGDQPAFCPLAPQAVSAANAVGGLREMGKAW